MCTVNKFIIKSILQAHKTEGPKEWNTNIIRQYLASLQCGLIQVRTGEVYIIFKGIICSWKMMVLEATSGTSQSVDSRAFDSAASK